MTSRRSRLADAHVRVEQRGDVAPPTGRGVPVFADARNRERLTPPWLRFEVLTPEPVEVRQTTRHSRRPPSARTPAGPTPGGPPSLSTPGSTGPVARGRHRCRHLAEFHDQGRGADERLDGDEPRRVSRPAAPATRPFRGNGRPEFLAWLPAKARLFGAGGVSPRSWPPAAGHGPAPAASSLRTFPRTAPGAVLGRQVPAAADGGCEGARVHLRDSLATPRSACIWTHPRVGRASSRDGSRDRADASGIRAGHRAAGEGGPRENLEARVPGVPGVPAVHDVSRRTARGSPAPDRNRRPRQLESTPAGDGGSRSCHCQRDVVNCTF